MIVRDYARWATKLPPEDTGSPKTPNQWHTPPQAKSRTVIE
jgi:hypothetical protein